MIGAFLTAAVLLTLAPGPDILFVVAQSLANGRGAGIWTAAGLCTGVLAHTCAAAVGLSALLYGSGTAFMLVKYAGAAYLLYLAWQALREGASGASLTAPAKLAAGVLYRRGVLMNVLNPKVSLFFLALLPQFVTPGGMPASQQMLVLGGIFMVQAFVVFTLAAWGASRFRSLLSGREASAGWINKGRALLYGAIGLRMLLDRS